MIFANSCNRAQSGSRGKTNKLFGMICLVVSDQ